MTLLAGPLAACPACRGQALNDIYSDSFGPRLLVMVLPALVLLVAVFGTMVLNQEAKTCQEIPDTEG